MIKHDQVEIGSVVSGQSQKLNGFHVLSLGIGRKSKKLAEFKHQELPLLECMTLGSSFGGKSLTIEKETKGKTGIEDGSLNLTWETIYLLAVQLVYTIQALIPEQYLVDFAAVKSGFSKKKYFGT